MHQLRNQRYTFDTRLDWIPQKDPRSKVFAAVDRIKEKQIRPRSYFVNKWLDQKTDGSCVGFAFAHELCSTPLRVNGWEEIDAKFAREQIYWEAQKIDPWDGGSYPGASPFYEGTSLLAGVKIIQQKGYIAEYRWAFGEQDLALAVSHLGPAVVGINWYEGMFDTDNKKYIKPTGMWAGGHAIVVSSIDPNRDRYRIWNSWGRDWGSNGWAYISRDDMARLLREDGEAVIPIMRLADAL